MLQNINIRNIISCLLWFIFSMSAQAQQFMIQGSVKDEQGQDVIGAVVYLHELNIGTQTNHEGKFILGPVKNGNYHLHIQSMGYKAKTIDIKVQNEDLQLNVSVRTSSIELNSVLVEESLMKAGQAQQTQPVNVITQEMMLKNANASFARMLEIVPGVSSINTGMGVSKPVIRGMGFNRVVVAENGIKQEGQQWGGDHGLEIDQFNVERVEVIKGPSSIMYGSDGIGGVVNIRPPAFPENNTVIGSALMTYRSVNDFVGASAMAGINKNNRFFRIRLSAQDYADYRVPVNNFTYNNFVLDLFNNRLKNTAGNERNFSLIGGINKNWGFSTITYSYFNQNAGFFSGAHGIPRAWQLVDDGDFRNIDLPFQRVQHHKIISNTNLILGNSWLEIDLGYQNNLRQEFSLPHVHGFAPMPDTDLEHQFLLQTYSANLRLHDDKSKRYSRVIGLSGNYQDNQIGGFSFLIPNFNAKNAGSFIYQQITIKDSLYANAGIRYDYGNVRTERFLMPVYESSGNIVGEMQRSPALDRFFSNFSGTAGLSWFPAQDWNIKLNAGTSFRLPTAPELTANGVHHGSFRHEMGDSTLTSERGYQMDVTIKHEKKNLIASFTPFFNYFDKFIFLDPTSQFSLLPDAGLIYRFNQANALHTGAEFFSDYHFTDQIHLSATAQYVFALNMETGYAMPFTPPASGRVEFEYEVKTASTFLPDFTLGTNMQWALAQNRVARNEPATPGFTVFNLSTLFNLQFGKQVVKLAFAVQNIFNARYYVHLNRYRLLNLPEPGRNFMVSLVLPFKKSISKNN